MAASPIGWDVARAVAVRVGGRDALQDSYHWDSLQPDFDELTEQAEAMVEEATGLRSLAGPARARVVDRAGWVDASLSGFERLLRPLMGRFDKLGQGPLAPVTRAATGAQVGAMVGFMSTRVLGQYDLLVLEDERPEDQDLVYYVGPNVLALEKRFSFPPREFRLWLALHEVTHRMQFTGVPWLRSYYLGLVEKTLASADPSPRDLLEALKRAADSAMSGRNPLADGGLPALIAGPELRTTLDEVSALMSLLEGHGDITMDRAGAGALPAAERFGRVLRQRREQTNPLTKLVLQLVGLQAKLDQYAAGERFIEGVEAAGGTTLFNRVWDSPANLPTKAEIDDPNLWVKRLGYSAIHVG